MIAEQSSEVKICLPLIHTNECHKYFDIYSKWACSQSMTLARSYSTNSFFLSSPSFPNAIINNLNENEKCKKDGKKTFTQTADQQDQQDQQTFMCNYENETWPESFPNSQTSTSISQLRSSSQATTNLSKFNISSSSSSSTSTLSLFSPFHDFYEDEKEKKINQKYNSYSNTCFMTRTQLNSSDCSSSNVEQHSIFDPALHLTLNLDNEHNHEDNLP